MKNLRKIIAAICVSLGCASAGAATINIDFEHLPGADGVLGTADDLPTANTFIDPIGEKFAAVGVHFTQGTLFQLSFFDGNPSNHFISSTNPIVTLSVPVFGIAMDSRSYWDAKLTAYDAQGNVIAENILTNPQAGLGFFSGSVSVTSATPIASFSILPPQQGQILNLDNLSLTVADPVPEPAHYLMMLAGLVVLAGRRRRSEPFSS